MFYFPQTSIPSPALFICSDPSEAVNSSETTRPIEEFKPLKRIKKMKLLEPSVSTCNRQKQKKSSRQKERKKLSSHSITIFHPQLSTVPSSIKAQYELNQFILKLTSFVQQATTFNERLQLLKNLQGFSESHSCLLISTHPTSNFYSLILKEENGVTSLQVLDAFQSPLFYFKHTLDNTLEEVIAVDKHMLSIEADTLRKTIKEFFDVSEHVVIYNMQEWTSLIQTAQFLSFKEKSRFLKQKLTFVINSQAEGEKFWWQAWLEVQAPTDENIDGLYLLMILTEDVYQSNTFIEQEISEYNPQRNLDKSLEDQKYLFIKFFDGCDKELVKPIYVNRIDLEGSLSELVYIQSIPKLMSGTDMRNQLHSPLQAFFNPNESILYDHAKIDVQLAAETRQIKLRQLRGGFSWYQSMDYLPFECHQKTLVSDKSITQSPIHYYAAAEKIQSITVKELYKTILDGYPSHQRKLLALKAFYLTQQSHPTLMSLISRINTVAREAIDLKDKYQANQDLLYLYDSLLRPFNLASAESSLAQKTYNLALSIIHETCIFHKPREKQYLMTFTEFCSSAHLSFDELVTSIVKKHHVSLWKDFIPFYISK